MRRLLCITAHPDDEAAAFGGTLRLYHDLGVETAVICLTPGQAASNRGHAHTDHELATLRRAEFSTACGILGVDRGVMLDYSDGKLHCVNPYGVVEVLTRHIREFCPQVVVTFGPEGSVTGHTDHSMASVFATLAYEWAGRQNRFPNQITDGLKPHRAQKLYYTTSDFTLADRPPISPAPITAVVAIGDHMRTKIRAFEAHSTQAPVFPVVREHILARAAEERFHLAATADPQVAKHETDLFEGIKE
jgi:LmbE family N-acetylglucosaminyl deacetylase